MGLFLSLFHPSDMFQKSVRCYLIMGAFLIWVPYGGFLWERFLLVGSFGKGVFWKRVLWKGNPGSEPIIFWSPLDVCKMCHHNLLFTSRSVTGSQQ